jgi:hypothetical protein
MAMRFAVGAVFTGALVCLSYGYTVLRAPTPMPALPRHIGLVGFTEPLRHPQLVIPQTDTCYTLRVIPPGVDCHPPGRYEARPESRMHETVVETIDGQRRILPSPRVTVETIKAGKSTAIK